MLDDDSGASPGWLANGNIEVDVQSLRDFAKAVEAEVNNNFGPSFQQGIMPMLQVAAPFGTGGMEEAKFFKGQHDHSRDALSQMLQDVQKGLIALHLAASSIAGEYSDGDATNSADIADVVNVFNPQDGKPSLSSLQEQAQQEQRGEDGQATDQGIPPQAQGEPKSADGQNPAFDPYAQQIVAEGESGQYIVGADDEGVNDPSLDVSNSADYRS
ncbi:hypothetical protein [Symbioplanes lichenis]|uniref:hypothetical protein n=1 Tax=Symbioplanes lichenis TaxID=1629072 RepID=UPI00273A4603|nr:hypothetical protein [Actinoplanes lichenis]